MAYILGYLYADGSLEDASYLRGKYLRVSSIDRESILKIKHLLNSKHKIVKKKNLSGNQKNCYLLRIGSHVLYNRLIELGLFPNKSLSMKFPDMPEKYLRFFVLGYFDGDGCVMVRKERNKKGAFVLKGLRVVFTCGSIDFLEKLAKRINNAINTKQLKIYNGHRSYMLSYSTDDSVLIFKFIYNISKPIFLKRKFVKFCDYFDLRINRKDKYVCKIIERFNLGRVAK